MLDTRNHVSVILRSCATGASEAHNQRKIKVPNSREDLLHLNISKVDRSIKECLQEDKILWESIHNKKIQSNMFPIKEAVFVTNENTTQSDIDEFCELCYQEFGIKAIQYYMHNDEGHYDRKTNEWMPNYHVHIIFDFLCKEHRIIQKRDKSTGEMIEVDNYGNIIQLRKEGYSRLQDLASAVTGMERGAPGRGKHLSGLQYTYLETKKNLSLSKLELEKVRSEIKSLAFQDSAFRQDMCDQINAIKKLLITNYQTALSDIPKNLYLNEREILSSLQSIREMSPSSVAGLMNKSNISQIRQAYSNWNQFSGRLYSDLQAKLSSLKEEVAHFEKEVNSYKYLPERLGLSPRVRRLESNLNDLKQQIDAKTQETEQLNDTLRNLRSDNQSKDKMLLKLRGEYLDFKTDNNSRLDNLAKLMVKECPRNVIENMKAAGLGKLIGQSRLDNEEKRLHNINQHKKGLKL